MNSFCYKCEDCKDSIGCLGNESCDSCINISFSIFCENCNYSKNLVNCKDMFVCEDCYNCTGLSNKKYCVDNKQLSEQ